MKKLVTLTTTFALVLITTALVQAKEAPKNLTANIQRAAANQTPVYLNDRVQQMCEEWPGCQEWVGLKSSKDISFQLVDTEVAHWISGWNGKEAVWGHRFYAQTRESGQIKAYEFLRLTDKEGENAKYPAPTEIKKFPGHPLPQEPSTHALVEYYRQYGWRNTFITNECKAWPGCMEAVTNNSKGVINIQHLVYTQYVSKWDAQGNAYWSRALWVRFETGLLASDVLYFSARQTRPGEAYAYESPKKVKDAPYPPHDFTTYVYK